MVSNLVFVQNCIANSGHEHHRDQKRNDYIVAHIDPSTEYRSMESCGGEE